MPCRSDYMEPTAEERKATRELRESVEALGDKLTYSMDVIREYLLGNMELPATLAFINFDADGEYVRLREKNDKLYVKVPAETMAQVNKMVSQYEELNELATRMEPPSKKQLQKIEKDQIEHRERDLRRLMKTLAAAGERELLKRVLDADNKKPLAPQLGFNPDDY